MNDDYLWDKTGEPDPEIEHLEQVLGTLRYQPRSFEVPRDRQMKDRATWRSWMAIAAAILIAIVAGGLWLASNRPLTDEIAAIQLPGEEDLPPTTSQPVEPKPNEPPAAVAVPHRKRIIRRPEPNESLVAEQKEAEAAKQQLLLALRLTSSKLGIAQKKVQGTTPGVIRNQHKVG